MTGEPTDAFVCGCFFTFAGLPLSWLYVVVFGSSPALALSWLPSMVGQICFNPLPYCDCIYILIFSYHHQAQVQANENRNLMLLPIGNDLKNTATSKQNMKM